MLQLAPGFKLLPHSLFFTNWLELVPLRLMLEIGNVAVVPLLSVTFCAVLALPTFTLPKLRL